MILREYYVWTTRKKRRVRLLPEKNFIAYIGTDERYWPWVYILFRGLPRQIAHTEAAIPVGNYLLAWQAPHFCIKHTGTWKQPPWKCSDGIFGDMTGLWYSPGITESWN